jgi:hypothetical protein
VYSPASAGHTPAYSVVSAIQPESQKSHFIELDHEKNPPMDIQYLEKTTKYSRSHTDDIQKKSMELHNISKPGWNL